MTGREIRQYLDDAGVLPSKQLGQNFLIDPNMARWIVEQLDCQPGDAVVEVGPGTGALSEHLLGKVRKLILIEFDARLAAALQRRFADRPDVEIHHADAARFDRRFLFRHRPLRFLGNLPYSSGGAILRNLLGSPQPFEKAVIMLQKEVIERLAAGPGDEGYGLLSLRIQADWQVQPLRKVPPDAFHPKPSIDSMVAVLTPRTTGLPPFDRRKFDEILRRGFAQRRKQLGKQLPAQPPWPQVAQNLGLTPTARAEELDLAQWVRLARAYDEHPLKDNPQQPCERFDVVDEADQVIGQASRAEVHAAGLRHRAVHVFVFHPRGDLLLQKRSHLKDNHPGVWDSSVSGHLDQGEDYPAAARRELAEEMGITHAEPIEFGRIDACEATGMEHVRTYRITYDGPLRFPCAEIEAAMWFPQAEIAAWTQSRPQDFAPGFLECWKRHLLQSP